MHISWRCILRCNTWDAGFFLSFARHIYSGHLECSSITKFEWWLCGYLSLIKTCGLLYWSSIFNLEYGVHRDAMQTRIVCVLFLLQIDFDCLLWRSEQTFHWKINRFWTSEWHFGLEIWQFGLKLWHFGQKSWQFGLNENSSKIYKKNTSPEATEPTSRIDYTYCCCCVISWATGMRFPN